MMRKLLLFFVMLCVSAGAWAAGSEDGYFLSGSTWCGDNQSTKENVAKIHLTRSGVLAAAIAEINAGDGFVYNANSVNLKTAKQIYINSDDGVYLSPEDILALGNLGYETIDLQDLNYESAFTFSNSNVKNLILPDGWTKLQVTNCATAIGSQLGSAFSIGDYTTGKSITAYVNKGNTLYDAVNRCFMDDKPNLKLNSEGGVNQHNMKKPNVKCLSISGNPVARDFSSYSDNILFDANGHFVFDQEASENSDAPNTGVNGTRKLTGQTYGGGAMDGVSLIELDLQDAVITEAHCSDLTLSWTFVLGVGTRIVRFPTCSELKTIPADCLAGVNGISEICIPSNIENIKTRAFAASIDHIWTTAATGDVENTCYDNGLYNADYEQMVDSEGNPLIGYTNQDFGTSVAGTYTFSSNLKLIERFAFSNTEPYVSDVFVLAEEAPECHVDAFGCSFYVSYSGYGVKPGTEGIVERSSFKNGNYWMTMLHYPRNCTTPQIQRYTDPTREYSIATGMVDGKGANIYFPQANEFAVAYLQGTYGYTWKAWDTATRNSWGDVTLHPGIATNAAWSAGGQTTANTLYTGQTPSATFYDTTLGGNTKPDGLQKYTEVEWEGQKLYPAPATEVVTDENGNPVMVTVPVRDANNEIIYDRIDDEGATYEGNYVRNEYDKYDVATDGLYCHPLTQDDNNGEWLLEFSYIEDPNGDWVDNPNWAGHNDWKPYSEYSWMSGITRYKKVPKGFVKFTDQWGQKPRFNIGDDYVLYDSFENEYKYLLTRYNKEIGYQFTAATSSDEGPFYTMRTENVESTVITKQYDYRGWHQFVLTGYAANSTEIITQHRSYLTDCDWWTICLPYDLTYNEMVLFYGDKASNKIPYLSILQNVVRDMKNESITLNFSENLMLHKATKNAAGDWEVSTTKAVPSDPANEVILHAGVPYLIRPNFVGSNRQFDIYGSATANANLSEGRITANSTEYPGLYEKLKAAETMDGGDQLQLVADGLITVPALVANLDDPDATMTENIGEKVFTYKGKTYPVSSDWDYTFVGSFYKSMIPAYSYYLGYDTKAKFFFANVPFNPNVPMYTGMKWNNNTAIICPNMLNSSVNRTWNLGKGNSDGQVTRAYGEGSSLIPAQWFLNDVTVQGITYKGLTIDDLSAKPSNSKGFGMGFGGFMELIDNGDATGINNVKTFISVDDKVYSLDGRHVGNSLNGLQKGTYVKNGKKYIVK